MLVKKQLKTSRKNIIENRSMFGILRDFGNHPFSIKYDRNKEIFSVSLEEESVNRVFDDEEGGIIVFSTDVNAVKLSDNQVINWVKKKFYTLKNRLVKGSMLDKIADKNNITAMTVGYYLQGRYKAQNGSVFTEHSLSIEVLGVDTDTLFSLAEDICRDFKQEAVLVKSYHDGGIYFVDNN